MVKGDPETQLLVETSQALNAAVSVYRRRWGTKATARLYSVFTVVVQGLDAHPKGSFELNANDHCLTNLVKQMVHRKSKM